jgi:replication-associated recombination protein RarA
MTMASLAEEFRPKVWADVAGQDAAVKAIRSVLSRGWGGRAWWLTGASGMGKTTLAKLIAQQGASELATEELDAGSITPAKLRELERSYSMRPLPIDGKTGWAIVVNECHRLRKDTVAAFLDVLERLPDYVVWIFTTTRQGQASLFDDDRAGDCAPLVSRCVEVELADGPGVRQALAQRAKTVAMAAGCDGLPDSVYTAAIEGCKGNLRALLQRVESGQLAKAARQTAMAFLQQPIDQQDALTRAQMQRLLAELS